MKDYTHICIVLDASGSMSSIEDDTKGSFNSFIKAQREAGGKTVFDLYQFSDVVRRLVEHVDLATFKDDLMARYNCSGCTALNDAVCIAIDTLGQELAAMKEEDRKAMVERITTRHGLRQLSYMKELGMGNDRYVLIDLDNGEKRITAADAVADVVPFVAE